MLGFRRATVLESPDSVRRVAATGMVGRRDQANRATVPPAHIAMLTRLTRMEAKTRPARSGAMAVVRSRATRPKSLDIRRPIQGRLDEGGHVEPLVAVVAKSNRPRTFGRPDPAQD